MDFNSDCLTIMASIDRLLDIEKREQKTKHARRRGRG